MFKKHERLQEIELSAAQNAQFFPGAIEWLRELRNSGINTGIFTRNCRVATQHVLKTFNIQVDLVVTREDAQPKPDPAGIIKFLDQWKLQKTELLFVGDFLFDIECGNRAGVKTALFTNGKSPIQDLKPDHFISGYFDFWKQLLPPT